MEVLVNVEQLLSATVIIALLWTIFKLGEVNQSLKETRKNIAKLDGCKPKKTV